MDNQHTTAGPVQPQSLTEKFTNIFSSPGELFENVRLTEKTAGNWLIPWILFVVVAIIMGQLMVHNASLADQLGAMIKKGFDKSVQEGKMSQERADQVYEKFAKPGSTWFTLAQIGGVTFGSLAVLFVLSLVYWLLGKSAMKGDAPYMKVVEVVGLTYFIVALEQIVTTLLMFVMDSISATPSLGIFVGNFDIENKVHVTLSKVNIFTFWNLSVVSIGLSKLFQRDLPKVLVLVFTLWALWSAVSILTGIRMSG